MSLGQILVVPGISEESAMLNSIASIPAFRILALLNAAPG
jgi:hypothetical protein